MTPGRRRSSATWLLLAYAALVVYASLYPFLPWHWPPGLALENVLRLSWPKYSGTFDIQANLAGYLPLGLNLSQDLFQGWYGRVRYIPILRVLVMYCHNKRSIHHWLFENGKRT